MSGPLSIMLVNMHHGWGGQPTVVLGLARGLSARGHACIIGAPEGSELLRRAGEAGVDVLRGLEFRRGFHPISILRDARIMRRCILERGVQVVESNGSQDTWASVIALRPIRDKASLVRWRHNSFPIANHLLNRLLYRRWIDRVVVSSDGIKHLLVDPGLLNDDEITVVHPSVELSRFEGEFDRAAARAELGLSDEDLVIATVGRLAPEKGHSVLLRAAKLVIEKEARAKFLVIGGGSLGGELSRLAEDAGIADHVIFAGFRTDVPRILSACDVNALTPVSGESFGIALLEGFCAGLPAVATDVGGVRSVCRDRETGLLCRPGDADCVAGAILELLGDSELRTGFARNGRRMVEGEFTEEIMLRRAEALFREVIGGGEAR